MSAGTVVLDGAARVVVLEFPAAMLEAFTVSQSSQNRLVAIVDLAKLYGETRRGYVVLERPAGQTIIGIACLVAAV